MNDQAFTTLEYRQLLDLIKRNAQTEAGKRRVEILGVPQQRDGRRDANDRLKKLLKDHQISEDDEKKGLDEVQKITDQHIKHIDDLQKKKDSELLGK